MILLKNFASPRLASPRLESTPAQSRLQLLRRKARKKNPDKIHQKEKKKKGFKMEGYVSMTVQAKRGQVNPTGSERGSRVTSERPDQVAAEFPPEVPLGHLA